jgi:hypothetical protein
MIPTMINAPLAGLVLGILVSHWVVAFVFIHTGTTETHLCGHFEDLCLTCLHYLPPSLATRSDSSKYLIPQVSPLPGSYAWVVVVESDQNTRHGAMQSCGLYKASETSCMFERTLHNEWNS